MTQSSIFFLFFFTDLMTGPMSDSIADLMTDSIADQNCDRGSFAILQCFQWHSEYFAMFSMTFRIFCFWIYLFTTVCFRIAGEMLTAHLTHLFKPNWQKRKQGLASHFSLTRCYNLEKKHVNYHLKLLLANADILLSNLNRFASTRNWILESFKDLAWSCDANMVGGSRRCNQTNVTY